MSWPRSFESPHTSPPPNGRQLIAIGASTGGTIALESILRRLPADAPPVVLVQHTLAGFVRPLVEWLDRVGPLRVVEASHESRVMAGRAYVAPADTHLTVVRRGAELRTVLTKSPPVHCHRPSVDVLFESLAALRHLEIVAVLLTGMGRDGAEGLFLRLRNEGAQTIAQDEASSAIFGMPKEAIARGAARHVAALDDLPERILRCLSDRARSEREVSR